MLEPWCGPLSTDLQIDLAALGARATDAGAPWADPFVALDRLGVAVLRWPFKDGIEGAYTRSEGQALAVVNSLTEYVRQRFTAAHELGHHVLYREGESPASFSDIDLDAPVSEPLDEETDADAFAAAFLMPRDLVVKVSAPFEEEERRVIAVMAAFEVSRKSAARRCHALDLITDETRTRFEKNRRTIPTLFEMIGATPPDRRAEKGRKVVDRHLQEMVVQLGQSGLMDRPSRLLRLTPAPSV